MHVDMDAFFAAVEQLRRPELRGQPVVVGGDGNPRKRGVVSTASYEARAYGIHSAMPLRTALKRCPEAIFLPVDFAAYRDFSGRLMRLLQAYSPLVEAISLDEAFVDISHREEDPVALARTIKERIRGELELTASIGVGSNKLLAKIAANMQKPDGLSVIWEADAEERLRDLPATVLWGLGPKTDARLNEALGIKTVGDLRQVSLERLQETLGPNHGEYLYEICRGRDDSPVVTEWEPKSYSRETTFQVDVRRRDTLVRKIRALGEEVWAECVEEDGYLPRTVTVKIRFYNFRTHTRAQTLLEATGDRALLVEAAVRLLDRFTLDRPVRLVGVRFSGLRRAAGAGAEAGATAATAAPGS
ncbi:MAG: DNA polymerase IV [Armatimonadetes bacterium]|nr:DNA polymerase IV [Armatimonadota bacterium]